MERWNERVAIVTGANSGIGYATAEKLVENGLKVVGLDVREDKLKILETKSRNGKKWFIGRIADISKKEDLIEAFNWTEKNIGPVSVVVNNAGINFCTKVVDCDFDSWKKIIDTNLYGLMVGCGLGLKQMKLHNIEDGHIININSVGGHTILDMEGVSFYGAAKHGVTAFTEAMRKELAMEKSKIRFTSISPGFVVSGMTGQPKFSHQLKDRPSVYPEDVAAAIISVLASPPHVQITELTIQPTSEKY